MGFDRARFAAANMAAAFGPRRGHLAALDAELCRRPGLLCGLVERGGVLLLRVMVQGAALRAVEVNCGQNAEGWVFTWAGTGEEIGPVTAPAAVADRVVQALSGGAVR